MKIPDVRVDPPGPKAKVIIERDAKFIATTTKTSPIVAKRATGSIVEDVDGNLYIDFASGISVINTGHCHPMVVEAVQKQAAELMHFAGTDFYYDIQTRFAEELSKLAPGNLPKKVFFANSGTEANEAAIKLARWNRTGKRFISFLNSFHGRTMGSLALTASKTVQLERFFPMMPGVTHVPYAYCYRCPYKMAYPECDLWCAKIIDEVYLEHNVPPKEIAAIFFEPIQGEGGYVVPPLPWAKEIEKIARKHDILLVADEVQTGMGRTGKMFAVEHSGVVPNAMSLAKGLGSGIPVGALVFDARLDFGVKGAHSNTFGGNLVACAAGLATLEAIKKERMLDNATRLGEEMHSRLEEMKEKYDLMGDNRGLGLMRATEFVRDQKTKEPAPKERDAIVVEALKRGLILLPCGESSIRYIPPLNISQELFDKGLDIVDEAIGTLERR